MMTDYDRRFGLLIWNYFEFLLTLVLLNTSNLILYVCVLLP